MHNTSFHFDDEEHVVAAQEHGVDGEEVGRNDALGLGAEELGPDRPRAPRGGSQVVGAQDVRDAVLRHGDAELLQLADDPQVAPARVRSSESHDQLDGLLGESRTPWSSVRVGPAPSNEGAMPAEDGLGSDEERRPRSLGINLASMAMTVAASSIRRVRSSSTT